MIQDQELLIKLLSVLFPDAIIYLFGSRARGTARSSSDIDIAIDAKNPIDILELMRAANVIEALNIPLKIDLVDFNAVPIEMQHVIKKEGKQWKA